MSDEIQFKINPLAKDIYGLLGVDDDDMMLEFLSGMMARNNLFIDKLFNPNTQLDELTLFLKAANDDGKVFGLPLAKFHVSGTRDRERTPENN